MFERFDEGARRSVVLAQDEAAALGHDYVGTEHLLIAVVAEGTGVAAVTLTGLGASASAVREAVGRVVGRTSPHHREGRLPITPRAKLVLEMSVREALGLQDNFIATEHLLLALLHQDDGGAVKALGALGLERGQVRLDILRARGLPTEPPAAAAAPPHSRPQGEKPIERLEATLQQILQQQEAILRSLEQISARLPAPNEDD